MITSYLKLGRGAIAPRKVGGRGALAPRNLPANATAGAGFAPERYSGQGLAEGRP